MQKLLQTQNPPSNLSPSSQESGEIRDPADDLRCLVKKEQGYGSDGVIDSEDEKRLDEMPALQRESIISERLHKRRQLIERYEAIKAMNKGVKPKLVECQDCARDSKHHQYHQKLAGSKRPRTSSSSSSSSSGSSSSSSSSSQSSLASPTRHTAASKLLALKKHRQLDLATLEDVERIRLSRDKIQELLQYPENFFEAIVNGAFARVVDKRNNYQMVTIVRVDKAAQVYSIGEPRASVGGKKESVKKEEVKATTIKGHPWV